MLLIGAPLELNHNDSESLGVWHDVSCIVLKRSTQFSLSAMKFIFNAPFSQGRCIELQIASYSFIEQALIEHSASHGINYLV